MNAPPKAPDDWTGSKRQRQRVIARSIWFTVPGTAAAVGAAYYVVPAHPGMEHVLDRLVLALRWLLVAIFPYVAVCLHIAYARLVEGSHNPLTGGESERLQIHCRVMQNTLEQLVWFAVSVLALSTYLSPNQVRLVPVLCVLFALARFVYWWGYLRRGTLGRAPGVQITFLLNTGAFGFAFVLLVRELLTWMQRGGA